jgi:hypothetical protein
LGVFLKERAQWVWEVMESAAKIGEMIREDAITSVNLAAIAERCEQESISLTITSFQGSDLESESGADWFWSYSDNGNPDSRQAFLVQAKRLDVVKKLNLLSYTINISQLKKLIEVADTFSSQQKIRVEPIYVFYNSQMEEFAQDSNWWGCTYVKAGRLWKHFSDLKKTDQAEALLSFEDSRKSCGATCWCEMFD